MPNLFEAQKRFIEYAKEYGIKEGTPTYRKCSNAFCVGFDIGQKGRKVAVREKGTPLSDALTEAGLL